MTDAVRLVVRFGKHEVLPEFRETVKPKPVSYNLRANDDGIINAIPRTACGSSITSKGFHNFFGQGTIIVSLTELTCVKQKNFKFKFEKQS